MDELIRAMSDSDLSELKAKYADNESVATLIDGILETRGKDKAQAQAKEQFAKGLTKMLAKLPHPDDIHNLYVRWAEVEEPIEGSEPVDVDVVVTQAVTNGDGRIVTPAVMGTESRQPMVKVFKWVVDTNKGIPVQKTANGTTTTSKRAITVYKRDGTNLELKGHFASASKACDYLKLIIGGDSATRVLARDGYITEPYEGTEYTS